MALFYNNGQSCCAVERIYVHERIYDLYLEEFFRTVSGNQRSKKIVHNTFNFMNYYSDARL